MNKQDFRYVLSRLLNSLDKLLLVKKYEIEKLRQQMALVHEQIEARLQAIEKNTRYINTERLIASVNINGSETLDAFVEQKMINIKKYKGENIELKKTFDDIQKQLFAVYMEQKQFEKVRENEKARIDLELTRKENLLMDEIATQIRHT